MKITLLERLEDPLPISRIWIGEIGGVSVPFAEIGGVICDIETKPALLASGLASCNPRDPDRAAHWPMQARVLYRHSDGSTEEKILEEVSAEPRLVSAVRRFNQLITDGVAIVGTAL